MSNFEMSDYKEVPERIREFRDKHPEGSLRPYNPMRPYDLVTVGDRQFIVYVAVAYRSPDDPCPGIGVAWEPFPGRTPYTRDSELQNAETSAWGRAIVASLASDSKHVASAEDVKNRNGQEPEPEPEPLIPQSAQADLLGRLTTLGDFPQAQAQARKAWKAAKLPDKAHLSQLKRADLPLAQRILDAAEAKVRKRRAQEVSQVNDTLPPVESGGPVATANESVGREDGSGNSPRAAGSTSPRGTQPSPGSRSKKEPVA